MKCLMCLQGSEKVLNIFLDKFTFNPAEIIKRTFWFTPSKVNPLICINCWSSIQKFHKFYLKILKIHKDLSKIQKEQNAIIRNEDRNVRVRLEYAYDDYNVIECLKPTSDISITDSLNLNVKHEIGVKCENLGVYNNYKEVCEGEAIASISNDNEVNQVIESVTDEDNKEEIKQAINNKEERNLRVDYAYDDYNVIECLESTTDSLNLNVKHEISENLGVYNNYKEVCETEAIASIETNTENLKHIVNNEVNQLIQSVTAEYNKEEIKQTINNKAIQVIELSKIQKSEEFDKKVSSFLTLNCIICSLTLSTFGKLKTHFSKVHKVNGYAMCCNKKYYKRSLLIDHIDTHINPEHFKCPTCLKTFTNKRSHFDHITNFHEDRHVKHSCNLCEKTFASVNSLNAHKKTHQPKEKWNFKCKYEECNKTYASREFLASHVHYVHKKITKICEHCGKVFDSKHFNKHMQKHSDIVQEKVQCHICNSFLQKKYFKIHLKNHEEANMDHICPTCGKKSPNEKALYKHIYEVHRSKKPHPCAICNKIFKSKDLLNQHIPVHTGENNYKCPFCIRTFKFKSNMHNHKKKEHTIEYETERKSRCSKSTQSQILQCS